LVGAAWAGEVAGAVGGGVAFPASELPEPSDVLAGLEGAAETVAVDVVVADALEPESDPPQAVARNAAAVPRTTAATVRRRFMDIP
jgi:hypothetical protein